MRKFKNRDEFVAYCRVSNCVFLHFNRKNVYIEYVRILNGQEGKGKPNAVLVAYKNFEGELSLGWSAALSPRLDNNRCIVRKGEEFSKPIGLWKAVRRATGEYRGLGLIPRRLYTKEKGESISVDEFIEKASHYLGAQL